MQFQFFLKSLQIFLKKHNTPKKFYIESSLIFSLFFWGGGLWKWNQNKLTTAIKKDGDMRSRKNMELENVEIIGDLYLLSTSPLCKRVTMLASDSENTNTDSGRVFTVRLYC